jgi:hypothetical protein
MQHVYSCCNIRTYLLVYIYKKKSSHPNGAGCSPNSLLHCIFRLGSFNFLPLPSPTSSTAQLIPGRSPPRATALRPRVHLLWNLCLPLPIQRHPSVPPAHARTRAFFRLRLCFAHTPALRLLSRAEAVCPASSLRAPVRVFLPDRALIPEAGLTRRRDFFLSARPLPSLHAARIHAARPSPRASQLRVFPSLPLTIPARAPDLFFPSLVSRACSPSLPSRVTTSFHMRGSPNPIAACHPIFRTHPSLFPPSSATTSSHADHRILFPACFQGSS